MKQNRFVKYLSDEIFGNPFEEYRLDGNYTYREQYNPDKKDYQIYINGIEVGSISPGELEQLQYRVFYSSRLWWNAFKSLIVFFLKPAIIAFTTLPLGVLVLLWLNAADPAAFGRELLILQDPVRLSNRLLNLFHLFYWITIIGSFAKLTFSGPRNSIFSVFDNELTEQVRSFKDLRMYGMMDIISVREFSRIREVHGINEE